MAQPPRIAGILLAAGRGERFDAAGTRDKLLQPLPDGVPVAVQSARHLCSVLTHVVAVVRPGSEALSALLAAEGCHITVCPDAGEGMGVSLVHALAQVSQSQGWVIALADMPFVQPGTLMLLGRAIAAGADIAVPTRHGRRGNPVAFGRIHLPRLQQLGGDQGARKLLQAFPVTEVEVEDDGVLRDIDTPGDLPSA